MSNLLRIAMLIALLGLLQLIVQEISGQSGKIFGTVKRSI